MSFVSLFYTSLKTVKVDASVVGAYPEILFAVFNDVAHDVVVERILEGDVPGLK